jgi:hypothetical protein
MATKFYIDSGNNYLGGFDGNTGKVPANAIEIPSAPLHAEAKWDGSKWIEPVPPRDELVQSEVIKQGVNESMVIQALLRKVGYDDSTLLDQLLKTIAEAEQKYPQ